MCPVRGWGNPVTVHDWSKEYIEVGLLTRKVEAEMVSVRRRQVDRGIVVKW